MPESTLQPLEEISLIIAPSPYDPEKGACSYLAFLDDRETWHSFPSEANYCHAYSLPRTVSGEHQNQFCLGTACADCLIYRTATLQPTPPTRVFSNAWVQKVGGAAFVWVLIGWMVRLILH